MFNAKKLIFCQNSIRDEKVDGSSNILEQNHKRRRLMCNPSSESEA
jgi:hypothetical protein